MSIITKYGHAANTEYTHLSSERTCTGPHRPIHQLTTVVMYQKVNIYLVIVRPCAYIQSNVLRGPKITEAFMSSCSSVTNSSLSLPPLPPPLLRPLIIQLLFTAWSWRFIAVAAARPSLQLRKYTAWPRLSCILLLPGSLNHLPPNCCLRLVFSTGRLYYKQSRPLLSLNDIFGQRFSLLCRVKTP